MSTTARRLAPILLLLVPLVAACGSDDTADAPSGSSRTVEIRATEYAFNGDPGEIDAGDTIEFAVENLGDLEHSLEVLSESGGSLGATARIPAGESGSVTVVFEQSGVYRLICDIDDHLSRGQSATITVG